MSAKVIVANVHHPKILIIGGGIAGASAAFWLTRQSDNAKVVLVEAEPQLAHHTTGRSAAQLIENYGAPANRPLTTASLPFFNTPPAGLVDSPLLSRRALLTVGRAQHDALIDTNLAEGIAINPSIREISPAEATELFPPLRTDLFTRAVLEPNSADIDVAALHQAFVRGIRAGGGTILTTNRITGLARAGAGWTLASSAGELTADIVINAAGAWGDRVAELAGIRPVGLRPLRRTAFMIRNETHGSEHWPLVAEADHAWYCKPDGPQLLCSPADETLSEPCDARPEEIDIAMAIDAINEATTLNIRAVASSWAGLRTFAPDDALVIGPEPDEPSFIWCVGQGGTGIQTSPGAGRLVSDLVLQSSASHFFDSSALDLAGLAPDRFR